VRARKDRNEEMADSGVDARVQRELQHESDSLVRRQRELEDAEISFLERQEDAVARAKGLEQEEIATVAELASVSEQAKTERQELDGRIAGLRAERNEVVSGLSPQLVNLYEDTRSRRGVGVALLEGGQCSACRITMAPDEVARLRAADEDQVETCEECGCLLLRD
jgi:predicted  nucleic acid-binding Zn-ribbon protein